VDKEEKKRKETYPRQTADTVKPLNDGASESGRNRTDMYEERGGTGRTREITGCIEAKGRRFSLPEGEKGGGKSTSDRSCTVSTNGNQGFKKKMEKKKATKNLPKEVLP